MAGPARRAARPWRSCATGSQRPTRPGRRPMRPTPPATSPSCGGWTAAIARCIATIPPAKRKLVTTHDALGAYARRYGLEVIATVIPSRSTGGQASAGETAALVKTIRRERVPAVFAESSVRSDVEDAIAREAGARVAPPLWADSLGPKGSSGATYLASMEANTHTIAAALGGDLSQLSLMLDTLSAPYMQRALVEIGLLAVLAGVLGAWIVLRRLAFFTHSVGTATFPGLVVAAAWGIAPQLAALGAALGFAGLRERLARGREAEEDAATGILLVAALALGALLASDVYRSGAGVDRLLFGTLIGLSDRDLVLTALAAALALAADAALRRAWLARAFDPEGVRALGVRRERPGAAAARRRGGRRDRGAGGGRRAAGLGRARGPRRHRAAGGARPAHAPARHRRARGGRGRGRAVGRGHAQRRARAGDGGARRRRLRASWPCWCGGADERARAGPRGRLSPRRGRPQRRELRGPARRGRRGPRPQRRRQEHAVPRAAGRAAAAPRRGRARGPARLRAADAARAARLPGLRARRRADGRLRAHALVPAARPRRSRGGAGGAGAASASRRRPTSASGRSRAASASAC